MKRVILSFVLSVMFGVLRVYEWVQDWVLLKLYLPYFNRGWVELHSGDPLNRALWLQKQPFYRASRKLVTLWCFMIFKISKEAFATYVSEA